MPEGDTLFRAARTLHAALQGREVTSFSSTVPTVSSGARQHRVVGRTVERVDAQGKHLLVRFEGGLSLHTHLGMTGSWHLYKATSPWRVPRHLARAVIETGDRVAVCFQAPTVEWLLAGHETPHPRLSRLGPDVLAVGFSVAEACARLRLAPDREIGPALLDQEALAGIGNIFKSESLYLRRLHPRRTVASIPEAELQALVRTASRLMRRSAGLVTRRTTPLGADQYWAYGRARRPCRRCGATIARIYHGRPSRSSYFCPGCQKEEITPGRASRPSSSPLRRPP